LGWEGIFFIGKRDWGFFQPKAKKFVSDIKGLGLLKKGFIEI